MKNYSYKQECHGKEKKECDENNKTDQNETIIFHLKTD